MIASSLALSIVSVILIFICLMMSHYLDRSVSPHFVTVLRQYLADTNLRRALLLCRAEPKAHLAVHAGKLLSCTDERQLDALTEAGIDAMEHSRREAQQRRQRHALWISVISIAQIVWGYVLWSEQASASAVAILVIGIMLFLAFATFDMIYLHANIRTLTRNMDNLRTVRSFMDELSSEIAQGRAQMEKMRAQRRRQAN